MDTTPRVPAPHLRDYVAVLRAHRWLIAATTGGTVLVAAVVSVLLTPVYESEAEVLVEPIRLSAANEPIPPNMATEKQLAESSVVARITLERIGADEDVNSLLSSLDVNAITDAEIMVFSYAHSDAEEARRRAQAFAQAYLEFRQQRAVDQLQASSEPLTQQLEDLRRQLRRTNEKIELAESPSERATLQTEADALAAQLALVQQDLSQLTAPENLQVGEIVTPAETPGSPASPSYALNIALAVAMGLGLGVGLAFLRERLHDRLRGIADVESRAGAPVLATLPSVSWVRGRSTSLLLDSPRTDPSVAEAYRTLRAGLLFAVGQLRAKVLLVTSPHPSEGKTTVTANLGLSLTRAGKRVIVVSGDLRRPWLQRLFPGEDGKNSSDRSGLTNLLRGETQLSEVLRTSWVPGLSMLPSGPLPPNYDQLLASGEMRKVLGELRHRSDLILIDSGPILGVADPIMLASEVDAVLLVVDGSKSTPGDIIEARQQLERVGARLIGTVINKFDSSRWGSYQYYGLE
ncbi:MAG: polysaccharide biosynthesis tyrosine autokinase [Actinomycetota bacterium]